MPKVSAEVLLAQKLAANEPDVRDKAVKRLTKWIQARTNAKQNFQYDEMLRLWKGLHYCFWMSDKMIIQEELAEKISGLLHSFGVEDVADAFMFMRCGFETLGREWMGIDRFRMDKFMMMARRMLRQIFVFAAKCNWSDSVVSDLVKLFEDEVVRANKNVKDMKSAIGFQLHFTDVYLEELAKIGGEDLPDEVVRKFLEPFVAELKYGKEDRLRSHIEERIFHHLMRQSDVGIAYEEDDFEDEEEDEDEEGNEENGEEEGGEEENLENGEEMDSDEDMDMEDDSIKDPRAGRVDITIPQLMVDYEKLSETLFEAGNEKKVCHAQRKVLFRLTKQFKALAEGKYPLSAELTLEEDTEVERLNMKKILKKAQKDAEEELEERKKEREAYQLSLKEKKRKEKSGIVDTKENSEDSGVEDESGSSEENEEPTKKQKKNKKKRKLEEEESSQETPQKKKKKKQEDSVQKKNKKTGKKTVEENDTSIDEETPTALKKKKQVQETPSKLSKDTSKKALKGKKKARKSSEDEPQDDNKDESSPVKEETALPKQKSNKKSKQIENETSMTEVKKKKKKGKEADSAEIHVVVDNKKSSKKKKKAESTPEALPTSKLPGSSSPPKIKSAPTSTLHTPIFIKKASAKLKRQEMLSQSTSPKSKRKKINFSLTCNQYQSLLDHSKSIQESPDVPFVPGKRARKGVLKNKNDISVVNTPSPLGMKEVIKNTKINSKSKTMQVLNRMRASDFF